MRDERRQQLVEKYEEAAISLIMDEYAESDGGRLLLEYENAAQNGDFPEIPAALDEKCRQMIDQAFAKQRRSLQIKQICTSVTKVSVAIFVFLGLITATILSVDALRVPVLNFLMDQSGRYSTVVFENKSDVEYVESNTIFTRLERNIPKGYQLLNYNITGSSGTITYANSSDSIIYLEVSQTEWGLNVDTEDQVYQEQDFCGFTAVFRDQDGYCLMWLDDQSLTLYTLFADGIDKEAFWELAYSIAK